MLVYNKKEVKSFEDAPSGYPLCLHNDCPMADNCLRAVVMRLLTPDTHYINVVNPLNCTKSATCPYFRTDEPLRYAFGFTQMQNRMFPEEYKLFMKRLQEMFGRNEFYRRRRGERPMPPREQELIREQLRAIGVPDNLGFDTYETLTNWYD